MVNYSAWQLSGDNYPEAIILVGNCPGNNCPGAIARRQLPGGGSCPGNNYPEGSCPVPVKLID